MKYGLIGEKLSHSLSPLIHRIFFDITGKKGQYELIELKHNELESFLINAEQENYHGLNVTIPYKTVIMNYMENISDEAREIGAVNTIKLKGGLKGYNTDYYGIDYTFKKSGINPSGKKVLSTGSGGAAKAVVAYLKNFADKIYIASRDKNYARKKFPQVIVISYEEIVGHGPFDIVINTTPVGMYPLTEDSPLNKEQLKGSGFLFDLIYNPEKTKLMRLAGEMGIPCVNGMYMLAAQAVKAQEIWQGENYGIDLVDAIYNRLKIGTDNF
ncbi:MAG: shikimate dehydrogenase [Clostridiaceae bacterium]|jgi:shikimate dehydrogenase|nr:shikimate dehydrogenase [Clostridiaceae bacterium]